MNTHNLICFIHETKEKKNYQLDAAMSGLKSNNGLDLSDVSLLVAIFFFRNAIKIKRIIMMEQNASNPVEDNVC